MCFKYQEQSKALLLLLCLLCVLKTSQMHHNSMTQKVMLKTCQTDVFIPGMEFSDTTREDA